MIDAQAPASGAVLGMMFNIFELYGTDLASQGNGTLFYHRLVEASPRLCWGLFRDLSSSDALQLSSSPGLDRPSLFSPSRSTCYPHHATNHARLR